MIDTHCHILPALDDGAKDVEFSVSMARVAVADGIEKILATPHMREGDYLNERPKVLEACGLLRQVLKERGIPLEVLPGSEVHLGPRLVERIGEGRILTYNDRGVHLLLECPYRNRPMRLPETVFELKVAGITPILAHPERIRYFQDEPGRYEELINQGSLGQLTTSSLVGTFGNTIKKLAEEWVERGLVHLLGSDAHDLEYRRPQIAAARDRWAALTDAGDARRATETWPAALCVGAPIEADPPTPPRRSRSWMSRFLGR